MTFLVKLNDAGDGILSILDAKDAFPGLMTPVGPALLSDLDLLELQQHEDFNSFTHRKIDCDPYLKDGKAYSYRIEEIPESEIIEGLWPEVRIQRNFLLDKCDWTVQPDAPTDIEAWKVYRQALRDITSQADPRSITWPEPPFEFVN